MALQIDGVDRKLLRALQVDSRKSVQVLGDAVGLSASACHRRLKALEEQGLIEGYRAVLNAGRLGYSMQFFIEVGLTSQSEAVLEAFEAAVQDIPEVLECHVLMGSVDFMLRVVAADIEAYESFFFEKLSRLPGIQEINSIVALSEIKSTTALPL